MSLPTKPELKTLALKMKQEQPAMKLGHCYEAIAKSHGFKTYAAMQVVMKEKA